jgi:hypothetical protein
MFPQERLVVLKTALHYRTCMYVHNAQGAVNMILHPQYNSAHNKSLCCSICLNNMNPSLYVCSAKFWSNNINPLLHDFFQINAMKSHVLNQEHNAVTG